MSDKKGPLTGPKRHRIALSDPLSGRVLIKRTLAQIFSQDTQLAANAGKIANLLNTWAKLYEMEKTVDLENRIAAIEKQQKEEEFRRKAHER